MCMTPYTLMQNLPPGNFWLSVTRESVCWFKSVAPGDGKNSSWEVFCFVFTIIYKNTTTTRFSNKKKKLKKFMQTFDMVLVLKLRETSSWRPSKAF